MEDHKSNFKNKQVLAHPLQQESNWKNSKDIFEYSLTSTSIKFEPVENARAPTEWFETLEEKVIIVFI